MKEQSFPKTDKDIEIIMRLAKSGYGKWLRDYLKRRKDWLDKVSRIKDLEGGNLAEKLRGQLIAMAVLDEMISDLEVDQVNQNNNDEAI